jgi:hypothetical protein
MPPVALHLQPRALRLLWTLMAILTAVVGVAVSASAATVDREPLEEEPVSTAPGIEIPDMDGSDAEVSIGTVPETDVPLESAPEAAVPEGVDVPAEVPADPPPAPEPPQEGPAPVEVEQPDADHAEPAPDEAHIDPLPAHAPDAAYTVATFENVALGPISPHTRLIAYHEASSRRAVALSPRGIPLVNENAPRVTAPPPSQGAEYAILGTRNRGTPATSAVDISLPEGEAVYSPVTGTVTDVRPFTLYGRHADTLVKIAPEGRPDLRVAMVHLVGTAVAPGDRVEIGTSPIAAGARQFPFVSQIDRLAGHGPHVHIEIRRVP